MKRRPVLPGRRAAGSRGNEYGDTEACSRAGEPGAAAVHGHGEPAVHAATVADGRGVSAVHRVLAGAGRQPLGTAAGARAAARAGEGD